jgi:hypothetical protein
MIISLILPFWLALLSPLDVDRLGIQYKYNFSKKKKKPLSEKKRKTGIKQMV